MRIVDKGLKEEKRIYTVSELTEDIKLLLENTFPFVWVEGEISNFRQSQAGHIYFNIKDAKSSLSCVFFKGVNLKLKFQMKDGLNVIAQGRINVYAPSGQYQLNVQGIEPKGIGSLQLAFQQLKERLQGEGLFDEARKKPLPFLPLRIGVVTSPTGAALRDILNIIRRRAPFVKVILAPVKVQGEGSSQEIAAAIADFNRYKEVDVLIVGRGGGSLEDLWAFNEEIVVRAIYDSKIPVISAVGHQTDWTISDFVSDLRAPTPSAAAELVVKKKEELQSELNYCVSLARMHIHNRIKHLTKELANLKNKYVLKYPLNFIQVYIQHVDELSHRLKVKIRHIAEVKEGEFLRLSGKLNALSPLNVLSRGYSIAFKLPLGKVIKDALDVAIGDEVRTRLGSGAFVSRVISKEEN